MNLLQQLAAVLQGGHGQQVQQAPQQHLQMGYPAQGVQGNYGSNNPQHAMLNTQPGQGSLLGFLSGQGQPQQPIMQQPQPQGYALPPEMDALQLQGSLQQPQLTQNIRMQQGTYGLGRNSLQGSGRQVQPSWDDPNQIYYPGQLRVQ